MAIREFPFETIGTTSIYSDSNTTFDYTNSVYDLFEANKLKLKEYPQNLFWGGISKKDCPYMYPVSIIFDSDEKTLTIGNLQGKEYDGVEYNNSQISYAYVGKNCEGQADAIEPFQGALNWNIDNGHVNWNYYKSINTLNMSIFQKQFFCSRTPLNKMVILPYVKYFLKNDWDSGNLTLREASFVSFENGSINIEDCIIVGFIVKENGVILGYEVNDRISMYGNNGQYVKYPLNTLFYNYAHSPYQPSYYTKVIIPTPRCINWGANYPYVTGPASNPNYYYADGLVHYFGIEGGYYSYDSWDRGWHPGTPYSAGLTMNRGEQIFDISPIMELDSSGASYRKPYIDGDKYLISASSYRSGSSNKNIWTDILIYPVYNSLHELYQIIAGYGMSFVIGSYSSGSHYFENGIYNNNVFAPILDKHNVYHGQYSRGATQNIKNNFFTKDNSNDTDFQPKDNEEEEVSRYLLTRGLDKTISVLMDKMNLQFTHTQEQDLIDSGEAVDKWIRLLMPKYTRRVEIEDLNRNFWVISQIIAAVCAKLFDEQSEIPTIMKDITNELTQLWENILYLWATLALQNQKVSNRVHTEMVPIEVSRYQNFNKYDFDQDDELSEEEIMERLAFYPKKYQQNLCIIPYLRLNNYKHNYYSGIKLLGIYLYHYSTDKWNKISLKNNIIDIPSFWEKKLYAIREVKSKMTYEYAAPYSSVNSMERESVEYFYTALRVIPYFRFNLKSDSLELFKFDNNYYDGGFYIYDAAAETALNDNVHQICKKRVKIQGGSLEDYYKDDDGNKIGQDITNQIGFTYRDSNIYKYSLYFGEVISKRVKCSAPIIQDGVFKIIKIGDFYRKSKLDGMSGETIKRNCFSLIPEEMETTGENAGYDWNTYGIGSYHINNANWGGKTWVSHDDVVRYVDYNHFYDTSRQFFYSNLDDLTPDMITELGRQYIYNLRTYPEPGTGEFLLSEDERSKPAIYATRIGVAYWTGAGGSVWNSGLIADLFFAYKDGDVQRVNPIGKVYLFDGYWTNSSGVIGQDPNGVFMRKDSNDSRYRRLYLGCDSLSIQDNNYIMTGGKMVWYDHNKDIKGISQPLETRPRADMELVKDGDKYKIEFSNFQNPIDGTLEMAIRIDIPENNSVFTSNETDKYYKGLITSNNEAKSLYWNGFIDGTWQSGKVEFTPSNDGGPANPQGIAHFYLRES